MDLQKWLVCGYTAQTGPDILLMEYDSETGGVRLLSTLRCENNPSFLVSHGGKHFVAFEFQTGAEIAEIMTDADTLELGARIVVPGAFGLCNLSAGGGRIFGACWGSGHVFCIDEALERVLWCVRNTDDSEKVPHAHCTVTGPDGFLYCADVGLDKLLVYDPADGALLRTAALTDGAAPRQLLFSPDGTRIFAVNENIPSIDIVDAGCLEIVGTITLPGKPGENYPGGACLSPGGLLFVPNRGPDTVSVIDALAEYPTALAAFPSGGAFPRSLSMDRAERTLLAMNQRGGNIQFFRILGKTLIPNARMPLPGAACAIQIQ